MKKRPNKHFYFVECFDKREGHVVDDLPVLSAGTVSEHLPTPPPPHIEIIIIIIIINHLFRQKGT